MLRVMSEIPALGEYLKDLKGRGAKLKRVLSAVMKQAGNELAAEEKRQAPKEHGQLQESIVTKVSYSRDHNEVRVRVGPDKRGWHGIFSEARQRSSETHVKVAYERRNKHTGITERVQPYGRRVHLKYHPFVRPAWVALAESLMTTIRKAIYGELTRHGS